MDGVLCNFESRYIELFNESPGSMRDRKEWSVNWTKFIKTEQFKTLDWFPGAHDLLTYIKWCENQGMNIEMLSSSGGLKYHTEVTEQKIHWLCDKGITYKANIVPGKKLKTVYANPESVLIDDTSSIIEDFNAAGGYGILHKEVGETLTILRGLLDKQLNIVI
jgi:hypothetical protein